MSSLKTNPSMVSDEMRRKADHFLDLADLTDRLGRDPSSALPAANGRMMKSMTITTITMNDLPGAQQGMAAGFPPSSEPPLPCTLCPRLHSFVTAQQTEHPDWHNGPVATYGDPGAQLLIVGLAPGLRGANRTGRPFTGDYAGDLLYATLGAYGFAKGTYDARPDDGVTLHNVAITNAVRCVPPQNKPVGAESLPATRS